MDMRTAINLAEALASTDHQNRIQNARLDKALVSKLKPDLCASGWEITSPGFFQTHRVESALGRKSDQTWAWCNDAIQELRAALGMKPKAFTPPPEKSKTGFVATSPKVLYHGTSLAAAEVIAKDGLEPRAGAFVKSAHGDAATKLVYAGAASDFHRVVAAMFFQAKNHIETDSDFFEATALIVLANDGKWFREKAGYESPKGVEGGDFYRSEPIEPSKIITGDALRAFFSSKVGRLPSDFIDFIEKDRSSSH